MWLIPSINSWSFTQILKTIKRCLYFISPLHPLINFIAVIAVWGKRQYNIRHCKLTFTVSKGCKLKCRGWSVPVGVTNGKGFLSTCQLHAQDHRRVIEFLKTGQYIYKLIRQKGCTASPKMEHSCEQKVTFVSDFFGGAQKVTTLFGPITLKNHSLDKIMTPL